MNGVSKPQREILKCLFEAKGTKKAEKSRRILAQYENLLMNYPGPMVTNRKI